MMLEERSENFKTNFRYTCNPPRYLELLKLFQHRTQIYAGQFIWNLKSIWVKQPFCVKTHLPLLQTELVLATFIALPFGRKRGLSVEAIDKLTGPIIGRPKSATFRTCDVVGLDTLVHVANGLYENCKNDEARASFKLPKYVEKLYENKWLGDKTKQGYYKKTKDEKGKKVILSLDLKNFEYTTQECFKYASLAQAKEIEASENVSNSYT